MIRTVGIRSLSPHTLHHCTIASCTLQSWAIAKAISLPVPPGWCNVCLHTEQSCFSGRRADVNGKDGGVGADKDPSADIPTGGTVLRTQSL